ncbi:MAG: hypothetical protein ABI556_05015 [Gemmatimonadales bacterium]
MKRVITALVLFTAVPGVAHGQFASAVAEGVRVRVSIADDYRQHTWESRQALIHGSVTRVTNDSLYLRLPNSAGTVGIDRLQIKKMAVSRGMQSPVESAVVKGIGSAIGFALSTFIRYELTPKEDRGNYTAAEATGISAAFGFGVGAFVGAIWPTEKWKKVHLGN